MLFLIALISSEVFGLPNKNGIRSELYLLWCILPVWLKVAKVLLIWLFTCVICDVQSASSSEHNFSRAEYVTICCLTSYDLWSKSLLVPKFWV